MQTGPKKKKKKKKKGDVGTYHSVFIPIPLLSNLESFQYTTFPRQMPTACYKLNTVYQT
jgi:hypothetical protein